MRHITDPFTGQSSAEVTIKERFPNQNGFKRSFEYPISISPALGLILIAQIAKSHTTQVTPAQWILKNRYIVLWPDGKPWDVDALQWSNSPIHTGEIEVDDVFETFEIPAWAIKDITGLDEFKFLGTRELQEMPFSLWTQKERKLYFEVMTWNRWKK